MNTPLDEVQGLNPFEEIRKESLDIHNRLHSIEEDIGFVNTVHDAYEILPLIRWYCPFPAIDA